MKRLGVHATYATRGLIGANLALAFIGIAMVQDLRGGGGGEDCDGTPEHICYCHQSLDICSDLYFSGNRCKDHPGGYYIYWCNGEPCPDSLKNEADDTTGPHFTNVLDIDEETWLDEPCPGPQH